MTRNEYTVDELADVLLRAGFVECNIAACNCGSWHHRYGLPERFSEIKDALMDAGVLNNETGNLPIRAIAKLVEQRDDLRSRLAEAEQLLKAAVDAWRGDGPPLELDRIDAFLATTDSASLTQEQKP